MTSSTNSTMPTSPIADSPVATSPHLEHLHRLLDRELGYEVSARHGFNNHLPMMLTAAAGLGASPTELDALFESTTSDDDYLIPRARPDWLDDEVEDIRRRGIAATVAERVPPLVDSPSTHWFHAAIRLEYAIDADHPGQVANSLHDWAEHRRPLPELPDASGSVPLVDRAPSLRRRSKSSIEAIAAEPWFSELLGDVDLHTDPLGGARELALAAHLATNSIATLHLVTGTRASRTIAERLPDHARDQLGRHIAQAIAAGYVAYGEPLIDDERYERLRAVARQAPSWEAIAMAALASGDAHVIKLAYTCQREAADHEADLYRWLAARAAGLVDHDR
jgi:hypothetical protein